ncbi:MAG: OmpA family protein [Proteobacteria bacterium]|nr:OmpA family protein [Pseudomonadota bacterium]
MTSIERVSGALRRKSVEERVYQVDDGLIEISNNEDRQIIKINSRLLFNADTVDLTIRGEHVLSAIADVVKENLRFIEEIKIEGHTDSTPSRYSSNLIPASLRASSVFSHFEKEGISPYETKLSATSFGEYSPDIELSPGDDDALNRVAAANITAEQKSANRRIEIVISITGVRSLRELIINQSTSSGASTVDDKNFRP